MPPMLLACFGPALMASPLALDSDLARMEPAFLSASFLDTRIRSRTHVTSRNLIVTEPLGSDWLLNSTVDLKAAGQLTENVGLTGTIPFGFLGREGQNVEPFFGNLKFGVETGWLFDLEQITQPDRPVSQIGLGFSVDAYFPTSTDCLDRPFCQALTIAQNFHPFEPELYVQNAMLFRTRLHGDFRYDVVQGEVEVALSPGFAFDLPEDGAVLLVSWAARLSTQPIPELELYSEVASSFTVVSPEVFYSDVDSPAMLTLAARLHLPKFSFDPALFTSIDLDDATVLVGLDLAGLIRNRPSRRARRAMEDMDF